MASAKMASAIDVRIDNVGSILKFHIGFPFGENSVGFCRSMWLPGSILNFRIEPILSIGGLIAATLFAATVRCVPNPPGANPLVAERAPWRSSQSCVTEGQQPIGNPYRFNSHFFCTPGNLCATLIVTRGEGFFSYQGFSTRGVRHSPDCFRFPDRRFFGDSLGIPGPEGPGDSCKGWPGLRKESTLCPVKTCRWICSVSTTRITHGDS